jgi:hypothetical protein
VPNGRPEAAIVERATSLMAALQLHAVIVAGLRAHGWTLVAYEKQPAARRQRRSAA